MANGAKRRTDNRIENEILYRALRQENEKQVFTDKELDQILKIERVLNEKHRIKVDSYQARNELKKEAIHEGGEILKTGLTIGAGMVTLKAVLEFERTGVISSIVSKGIIGSLTKFIKL